jgi:hypothetical protein
VSPGATACVGGSSNPLIGSQAIGCAAEPRRWMIRAKPRTTRTVQLLPCTGLHPSFSRVGLAYGRAHASAPDQAADECQMHQIEENARGEGDGIVNRPSDRGTAAKIVIRPMLPALRQIGQCEPPLENAASPPKTGPPFADTVSRSTGSFSAKIHRVLPLFAFSPF